ncbi:hypothetical protein ACFTY7_42450 [Streptomyces sp. NPDC057062]|uniref:hypothetical protein n=1 Tax=Streptomyces sp. NPDC057062 TaxID=3346011 RepID=UPI003625DF6B
MRRSAHVPFAAVAGAAPGAVAAPASAGPAARITPRTVAQGGLDTVSVSCDAVGGALPEFIDATSYAFDEGRVRLDRVGGHDYADGGGMQARSPGAVVYSGTARIPVGGKFRGRIPGQRQTQSRTPDQGQVPGQYRGQARSQGREGSDDRGQGQSPPGVQHGSQAGMGGAFCGSVPSLVAGGPLSAAVLGAAAHRLRRHGPSVDR